MQDGGDSYNPDARLRQDDTLARAERMRPVDPVAVVGSCVLGKVLASGTYNGVSYTKPGTAQRVMKLEEVTATGPLAANSTVTLTATGNYLDATSLHPTIVPATNAVVVVTFVRHQWVFRYG